MLQLFPEGDETYSIKEIGTNCGIEILNDKKELNINDLKGKYNLKNIMKVLEINMLKNILV